MTHHVFVDETKHCGYLMAAAAVLPRDLTPARQVVRDLLLPGQRRIHFTKERDSRRRCIVAALVECAVQVTIFDASRIHPELRAREACLTAVVGSAFETGVRRLVIELDESLEAWDRALLVELTRKAGRRSGMTYEVLRTHEEGLLAIADVAAWCWAKGGDWKRRIQPIVCDLRKLP